ncbi:serine hydrolase domain-containing protein [Sphingomonas sp. LY54]|uniref:serine hydrolase domain-containing protein n=1 Tax=Sphingomonas sp. LY54 TaxID=3095343 RepID=UPI002D79325E|nr:serine hydrolase domain-containing protein [Sphingomonas sp. LY54]WRP28402.1 serine hydrolase domain-containing protein [Sphingomonas sp. LY54]
MRLFVTACAILLTGAATSFAQAVATAPGGKSPAAVTIDAHATPSGATFTAPAGWTLTTESKFVQLAAPERDFRMALVDVGAAQDAGAAAAAAWKIWRPAQARPAKLVTARAARNGWDERQVVDYETSPNEKRVLYAVAFRGRTKWTVVLVDGAEATAEKRLAAIGLVQQSLRPAGYKRETFAGRAAHPMDASRIAALRTFVEQSMKELGIPGAAIALTTQQGTIYSAGLGVRQLGDPTPVDADTTFAIASNTKGMATLLLAKLVDEEKLAWDQPVTQVYPSFKLGSPQTTSKVLVRHLVCACTGLPRKDMQVVLNSNPDAAAADTFVQLAATEPTSGFGEVFQYNNLMASAAGYLAGYLLHPNLDLDRAFDRAVTEHVWAPLGMARTTLDFNKASSGNWARPHGENIKAEPELVLDAGMKLNYAFTRYGAAGGAWSTANDLIRYVRFELNEGKLDNGRQHVSAKNLLERRVATVPVGEDRHYGMGMQVDRDYGVDVVHHGGSLAGYKSDIVIIPNANVGAVILTNSDNGQSLLRPFMRRLLELLYDGKPEAAGDVSAAAQRLRAEIAKERELVSVVPDSQAAAALASSYVSPDLGRILVKRDGAGVRFDFRTLGSPMGTKRNEDGTISFVGLDPTLLFFPLVAGTKDGKKTLTARDSQHEFVFVEE